MSSKSDEIKEVDTIFNNLQIEKPKYKLIKLYPNEPDFNSIAIKDDVKAAIISIILYTPDKKKVLCQQRSELMTHPNEICGPGGRVDPNETWLEALFREVLEESGIDLKNMNIKIWCVYHNLNMKKDYKNVVFAAEIPFDYKFVKPTHLNELNLKFSKTENGHKWCNLYKLTHGYCGKLLNYFSLHLSQFERKLKKFGNLL
jgi:8-oxo-dGTP pyrophosphatase MutT (NUDIX family)